MLQEVVFLSGLADRNAKATSDGVYSAGWLMIFLCIHNDNFDTKCWKLNFNCFFLLEIKNNNYLLIEVYYFKQFFMCFIINVSVIYVL